VLIGNGRLTDKIPLTLLGRDWNAQLQPGCLPGCTSSDNFGSKAALPSGYYNPHGWMLPRKGGNLRAGLITGSGAAAATGQSGYNIDASISGAGDIPNTVSIGLIISIAASIAASGGISAGTLEALASMAAEITGSSSVTATAQGLADLAASLYGEGAVNAGNTALMDIASTIRGYGDLTPEGIRDSVWQAVLANYTNAGTAGLALSTASSGGVAPSILAAAVWAYATRSMTVAEREAAAAEILAAAQITPIHSNIKQVNSVTVSGTGVTGNEWGPA